MADIIVRPVTSTSVTAKIVNTQPVVITVSEGFIGPPGRAATATVGTTTTGAAGSNASVTNVGNVFDAVFDFVIPKGDTGDAATIAVGTVSTLNPNQNPTVTNSGTSGAAVLDFGLPSAATLDLGVVTIVNPDQNPSITDVGTSGNVVFDINIPRAADVTVQSAVTLTPDQNPSVADNGTNGDVNLTFSIPRAAAVNVNAVTTVNPNVNPSVADTGTDGDVNLTFSIPRAAALDLGTITVVTPDQNPSITDVGTNGDAEFNFSLPRASTITLEPTTVLTPDLNPSVADTGTNGDAVYTFSIPRASVVSLGTVSVLNPDQNPAVTSTVVSGDIAYNFSIPRAADVSVGTVTQLSSGTTPTVTDSGTSGDVVLDFGLPQGEAATIDVGTVTVVNPNANPSVTNVGTTSVATLDFDLPRASTFTVGTVTTGAAGTNASIANIGTDGDVVLDFAIPRGDKGDTGDTGDTGDAATLDLGTVTVVNPNVNPSVTNVGTVNAAIFDVNLPRASAVSIGTVTTVEFDESATVTDVGTNGDVILDFEIPRGTIGVDGAPGIVIDATEPANTDVLWADTSEPGDNVLPSGGATGEYLAKSSASDFDAEWTALTSTDVGLGSVPNLDTTDAVNKAHDQNTDTSLDLGGANEVTAADARAHIDSTSNPHGVTKAQVGLGDVDNVSAASLRDRSTHTGTQTLSTISDAGNMALQNKESVNIDGGTIDGTAVNATNLAYTGTLTGGTGVVNLGSGQVYKDANGNVGVGTNAPASGISSAQRGIHIQHNNVAYLSLDNTNSPSGKKHTLYSGADGALNFYDTTSNTERMRIDAGGRAIIPAGVTLGTSAGVYNAANTLDDYEEGTWTPTLIAGVFGTRSFTSVTYDVDTGGNYVKIGKLVIATFRLRTNAITVGAADGAVAIGNLPFTVVNNNFRGASGSISESENFAPNKNPQTNLPDSNVTHARLMLLPNTGATPLTPSDVGTGNNSNKVIGVAIYSAE